MSIAICQQSGNIFIMPQSSVNHCSLNLLVTFSDFRYMVCTSSLRHLLSSKSLSLMTVPRLQELVLCPAKLHVWETV